MNFKLVFENWVVKFNIFSLKIYQSKKLILESSEFIILNSFYRKYLNYLSIFSILVLVIQ